MNVKWVWKYYLDSSKEVLHKNHLKKLAVVLFPLVIVLLLAIVGLYKSATYIGGYSARRADNQQHLAVVAGVVATQLPSVPGKEIGWLMRVEASTISAGQHLVEIPKTAMGVKVSKVVGKESIVGGANNIVSLTKQDRVKLQQLSIQNAKSEQSIKLAESLKKTRGAESKSDNNKERILWYYCSCTTTIL